jgi:hypothetical protein
LSHSFHISIKGQRYGFIINTGPEAINGGDSKCRAGRNLISSVLIQGGRNADGAIPARIPSVSNADGAVFSGLRPSALLSGWFLQNCVRQRCCRGGFCRTASVSVAVGAVFAELRPTALLSGRFLQNCVRQHC